MRQVMRRIPPGEFSMGSPPDESGRADNETLHPVTLHQGFWLAESACTQVRCEAVMRTKLSQFAGNPRYPVESVSWDDCSAFFGRANRLLSPEPLLRCPTEAEWEYACRAGTVTAYSGGSDISPEQASFRSGSPESADKRARGRPVEVLEFAPNPWGLYQMHGNVWEWCADWYGPYPDLAVADPLGPTEGRDRVLRGGSWLSGRRNFRSANRFASTPGNRYARIGLRLAGG